MPERKNTATRKSEIAAAALALAFELGPDRITTELIAGKLGLSQAAVFKHFPRKADIWVAVIARVGERLAPRWEAAVDAGGDPLEQLRAVLAAQLETIESMPAIPVILFSRELHVNSAGLRAAVQALMQRFHRLLRELLEAGVRAGVIRDDIDASDAAFLVIALIQGLAVRWSLCERRFDLAAAGQRQFDNMLRGFAAQAISTDAASAASRSVISRR